MRMTCIYFLLHVWKILICLPSLYRCCNCKVSLFLHVWRITFLGFLCADISVHTSCLSFACRWCTFFGFWCDYLRAWSLWIGRMSGNAPCCSFCVLTCEHYFCQLVACLTMHHVFAFSVLTCGRICWLFCAFPVVRRMFAVRTLAEARALEFDVCVRGGSQCGCYVHV